MRQAFLKGQRNPGMSHHPERNQQGVQTNFQIQVLADGREDPVKWGVVTVHSDHSVGGVREMNYTFRPG